jgi:hypothetical protein
MAAQQAGIEWHTWMKALGGREFDLFIDPGCVRVRFAGDAEHRLVWTASPSVQPFASPSSRFEEQTGEKETVVEIRTAIRTTIARATRGRLSQLLSLRTDLACFANSPDAADSDADSEDSDSSSDRHSLFSSTGSISSRSSATSVTSSWPSPKKTRSTPFITFTPASPIKPNTCTFTTAIKLPSSVSVPVSVASAPKITRPTSESAAPMAATPYKMSRRERARQHRAGIVTVPVAAPTPYDGGRTTVLGGGVKLGGAKAILSQ